MKKTTQIFDKLDLLGMINYEMQLSERRNKESIDKIKDLNKRLEETLKKEGI